MDNPTVKSSAWTATYHYEDRSKTYIAEALEPMSDFQALCLLAAHFPLPAPRNWPDGLTVELSPRP